ncbi:MAG: glycosyltransferase, partial [Gemmatimonadetes bacterium]|nr:glycosyltransferase [Gemmatimonadota bacterium]
MAESGTPNDLQTLVVIPTYNERENLPRLIPRIIDQGPAYDVLVVDDNSPDGTGELAEELARESERIHVLRRPGKAGLGAAYVAGLQWGLDQSRYDVLVEMDADLSHP